MAICNRSNLRRWYRRPGSSPLLVSRRQPRSLSKTGSTAVRAPRLAERSVLIQVRPLNFAKKTLIGNSLATNIVTQMYLRSIKADSDVIGTSEI